MQIDWFTFGAQIINFLILVALLRRFLYGPIVAAMEKREENIAAQIEEAERERERAEEEAETYRRERQSIEARREELLAEAREAAAQRRQELIDEMRAEVETQRDGWQAAVQREKDAFLRALRERVGEHIFRVIRRALADLADVELEQHVVDVFASRLRSVAPEVIETSLADSREMVIHSAFELSDETRERLADILQQQVGNHVALRFDVNADLISGILLKTGDYQLGWNLRDYLSLLEERVVEALAGDLSAIEDPAAPPEKAAQPDAAEASAQ